MRTTNAAVVLIIALAGAGSWLSTSLAQDPDDEYLEDQVDEPEEMPEEVEEDGYESDSTEDGMFGGNDCLDDCAGHAAGYRWAEVNGITDAGDCGGNSLSFYEGCVTYTEDPYRGADEDDAGNPLF